MTILARWNARRIAAARKREAEREALIVAAKADWLRGKMIAFHHAAQNGSVAKANTIRDRTTGSGAVV